MKNLPIGMYGAVMGLAGLGLTGRAAAPLFPGVIRAPAYFTEACVALGLIALLILAPLYVAKLVRFPAVVREEFANPATLGFCGALPVGVSLVAGGLGPYAPQLGEGLWWIAFFLLLAFQVWALLRILAGGIELAQVNAGWLIMLVGGIVLPGPGLSLGLTAASHFTFGVSAAVAPILMAILFYRAARGPALPEALRPSWFILLVPPSLIYANGLLLFPEAAFLENLFYFAVLLAVALVIYARGFLRWPFGPAWWAFTFPLDALAYAAVRFALTHDGGPWGWVAGIALAAAIAVVALVLLRTLARARYLFAKRL